MMTSWFDDLIEKNELSELNILGMRMDEFIDMNQVNENKVLALYKEAYDIISQDVEDMDVIPDRCREIESELNNWELIVLGKLLSKHKHGRKGYHTIFNEYTKTIAGETE